VFICGKIWFRTMLTSRADDIMLTAEELRLRHLKRRRILILLLAFVSLILIGIFAGRPIAGAIEAWQSRRHAARVLPLLEKQQWSDARNEAFAAYQLRPNEPEAIRAVARYLSRTRQHQALELWEQLAKLRPLTRDDLRDEAAVALMSGETQRATPIVKSLIDRKDAMSADWFLAAQLALQKGNRDEAQSYLQKIVGAATASERDQLQATVAELAISSDDNSANASRRADALNRLEKLSRGKSEVALDALVILAQRTLGGTRALASSGMGDVPFQQLKDETELVPPGKLARELENHPLAKAPHKLLALDLQIHADPSQKDALISRGIADWKDADAQSLAALATWLNGKGEYQRNLDAIPLEKALQTREVFLQHVDALGALGRWSEIKQLLNSERFPLDPVIQQMYLARCTAQLGEKTAAENSWQRALEATGSDVQKLLTLADYAEKNGVLNIAATAYNSATSETPNLRLAQQGRLRLAQAQRDTRKIHAILADMLKLWPNDTAIQNDEAYMRLLLISSPQSQVESRKEEVENERRGDQKSESEKTVEAAVPAAKFQSDAGDTPATTTEELIAIEKLAEELVRREPASLPHRTLLALALLKQHRLAAALDVYSNINVAQNALSPSALAVHAAVLAANDHRDDARKEIQQVHLDQLLPEEQAATADLR
jgi:tetratricopeptide (TPR) repeat protein